MCSSEGSRSLFRLSQQYPTACPSWDSGLISSWRLQEITAPLSCPVGTEALEDAGFSFLLKRTHKDTGPAATVHSDTGEGPPQPRSQKWKERTRLTAFSFPVKAQNGAIPRVGG